MYFHEKCHEPGTYQLANTQFEVKVDTSEQRVEFLFGKELIPIDYENVSILIYDLRNFWGGPPNTCLDATQCHGFMTEFISAAGEMLKNPDFAEPAVSIIIGVALLLLMKEKNLVKLHLESYYRIAQSTFQLSQFVEEMQEEIYYAHREWFDLLILMSAELQEGNITNNPEKEARDSLPALLERCRQDTRLRIILERLTVWFLRRYDLEDANKLINAQRDLDNQGASKNNTSKKQRLQKIGRKIIGIASNKLFWGVFVILLPFVVGAFNIDAEKLFSLLFLVLIVYVVYSLYRFCRKRDVYWFKKMIPRLLGGIIVGYLPLLMTGEMWQFCMNITWLESLQIIIVSLLACWIYLYVEVNNAIRDKNEAIKRANSVFLLGCIESLIVGLVFCSLFGQILIEKVVFVGKNINFTQEYFLFHLPKEIHAPILLGILNALGFKNLVHFVYPPVILLYFPLALFIGIFVQIIWEDKPITEPL